MRRATSARHQLSDFSVCWLEVGCSECVEARNIEGTSPESLFFFLFLKRLGLFLSQQELTSRSSHRFSNVPAIPTCHSWAQGRGKAGRRHSGAGGMVAADERCSWPRSVLSFPREAVGGRWIVLALLGPSRLLGCASVSASDSWRWCAGGSPGSSPGRSPSLKLRGWALCLSGSF